MVERYPELQWASPTEVLQVDAVRDARGELPSRLSRDMTKVANALVDQRSLQGPGMGSDQRRIGQAAPQGRRPFQSESSRKVDRFRTDPRPGMQRGPSYSPDELMRRNPELFSPSEGDEQVSGAPGTLEGLIGRAQRGEGEAYYLGIRHPEPFPLTAGERVREDIGAVLGGGENLGNYLSNTALERIPGFKEDRNSGTRIRDVLEKVPGVGGALGTAFDVGAAPTTAISAGALPGIARALPATGRGAGTARNLLSPITRGGFGSNLAAETALGTGVAVGAQELAERDVPAPLALAGGLAAGVAGVGAAQGIRAGVRAADDALGASAIRAAEGPLESSVMGRGRARPVQVERAPLPNARLRPAEEVIAEFQPEADRLTWYINDAATDIAKRSPRRITEILARYRSSSFEGGDALRANAEYGDTDLYASGARLREGLRELSDDGETVLLYRGQGSGTAERAPRSVQSYTPDPRVAHWYSGSYDTDGMSLYTEYLSKGIEPPPARLIERRVNIDDIITAVDSNQGELLVREVTSPGEFRSPFLGQPPGVPRSPIRETAQRGAGLVRNRPPLFSESAIRAAQGPLESSTLGTIRPARHVVPGTPGGRVMRGLARGSTEENDLGVLFTTTDPRTAEKYAEFGFNNQERPFATYEIDPKARIANFDDPKVVRRVVNKLYDLGYIEQSERRAWLRQIVEQTDTAGRMSQELGELAILDEPTVIEALAEAGYAAARQSGPSGDTIAFVDPSAVRLLSQTADLPSLSPSPGAVDPFIPGVTRPRPVRGGAVAPPQAAPRSPVRDPESVLSSSQSDAARFYAERAQASDTPVSGGIVDAFEQASAAVRTDPQGVVSRVAGNIPGLRNIRNWDRPGLTMEKRLLEGHVARRGVESSLLTQQGTVRTDALRTVEEVFGDGAASGARVLDDARVNVDELHAFKGQEYPGSGTAYDALQRPYAYNLTPEQAQALRAWSEADEALRVRLNEEFGGDVAKFVPERGGVYVQNINRSEARLAQLEELARREGRTVTGTGKSKQRVWETGFDRWKSNVERGLPTEQVFVPETDLNVLGYTSDLTKANAAGDLTFRASVGGRTISEVKEEVAPRLTTMRDGLRRDITSLRGRITRAEQSLRKDNALASRYEAMQAQTLRRSEPMAERVDEIGEQYGPELSFLSGQLRELDARANSLAGLSSEVRGRADLTRQGVESLRDDLAEVMEQYAEVKRAYDAVDPQDFVQPTTMPGRYFPTREAAQLEELARPAKQNLLTRTLEGWRSQVLAGDIGPLTGIQGIILAASGRAGTTRAIAGSLAEAARTGDLFNAYRADAMDRFLRENADIVREFSFATGRNVGGRLPAEIGQGGLLAQIPGFTSGNEAMFNVVTRRQIEMFKRIKGDLIKAGYSNDEAVAAAGDLSSKVVPLMTAVRLGQSAAKAQEQRFLPTSLGFIRQPLALTEEAFTAMGRVATGQKVTPRQKLALSIYSQFIGNLMAIGVSSAAINAVAQDGDVEGAIIDSLDTESRAFMAISAGDKRIPLANPFRSPLRVGIGTIRNMLNPAVESATGMDISQDAGASAVNYVTGRTGPPLRASGEAFAELTGPPWERNYQGDSDLLRLLSAGAILGGGALPIPAQGIAEEVQEQRKAGEFDPLALASTALAETASFNLIDVEDRKLLDAESQQAFGAAFDELDRGQRRTVLLANPDLVKVARDDTRDRMDDTGYAEADERAWSEMSEAFGISGSYEQFREEFRNTLEKEGAERTAIEKALREDPLVQAYQKMRRGLQYEWYAEHLEDGLTQEAYDFGLIPDNENIRRMLGVGDGSGQ